MSDQNVADTPGSNVDVSVNGTSKSHAPKDKACPFCHQQFTSSSLGRHLDLYIKEKNPKPADGLHDIDEIRKMRGGITRRQPRNSMSKRENSLGTPAIKERRSPRPEPEREKNASPSLRRYETPKGPPHIDSHVSNAKMGPYVNRPGWESTAVMNSAPAQWGSDARSWDGEDRDASRRPVTRSRSVSRKIIAKTSLEQKQKMIDALDTAKAAELAFRELAGSVRAAKRHAHGLSILDFDPLSMDFPALCLQCLPPPPTLHTSTPIPSPNSWSLSPPDDSQYQAIRNYFTTVFHNYRMSLSFSTATPKQDMAFPSSTQFPMATENSDSAATSVSAANQLEVKVNAHLQAIYRAWQALPTASQTEIWTISLARSIALKSKQIDGLKQEVEKVAQDSAHLRQQIEDLSRLQYPREFKIIPPRTARVESELIAVLGEQMLSMGVEARGLSDKTDSSNRSTSQTNENNVLDESVHLDVAVERVIARWKSVVKEVRSQLGSSNDGVTADKGLIAQQSLSGDSVGNRERIRAPNADMSSEWERVREAAKNEHGAIGVGSDADADADMEEDDTSSFVEMVDAPPVMHPQSHNPQMLHQNHQPPVRDHGFRISSGNTNTNAAANNPCTNGGHFNHNPDGS